MFNNIVLAVTAITTALMAGLFYAYSFSVSPGLGRLADAEYIRAMQHINRAILNPVFFLGFMGTLLLLPLSTYLQYSQPVTVRFWCLLAATLVYAIGVFGVTMAVNVPLNEALNTFNTQSASLSEIAAHRAGFEARWNSFNNVRTFCAVAAMALVAVGCIYRE
ncbi:anthrone oxygenase family protein [Chitinophaga alhagiae]|uniref:anthrone oxygenase family protein n=1 Tax=Chitinophaga alhagiae TaxID=2203219 RepID=UPI000E5B8AEF|nr:anthrone oxygenase family protein [Chitinophaga alhagiae]